MEEQAILGKLKYLINKKRTIENIMKELGLKEYEVFGFVEILRQDGYHIKFDDGKFYFDKKIEVKVPNLYEMPKGISRKMLLISDTHLGSKYDRLDILRYLYERAEEEEIDTVLHCGDLGDGLYPNRPNHQYELRVHGVDEHLDYIVNKYPHKDGIRTLFIGGNHDYDYIRTAGFDMGKAVSKARPDMIYLGQDVADVKYGRTRIRMFHGNKSPSYARCFDDKTEILTENGFKLFKDLTRTERVATLNLEKDTFEWQKPIAYVNEPYSGDMIHIKNRTMDTLVTPNHRMLVRKNPVFRNHLTELQMPQKSHQKINWDWQVKEAAELIRDFGYRQNWQFKRGGQHFEGNYIDFIHIPELDSDRIKHLGNLDARDVAELIGWYVTEGYLRLNKKQGYIAITQSLKANPEKVKRILDLGVRMGFENIHVGKDKKTIYFYSKELASYIYEQCGKGSYTKFLPKWLKEADDEILNIVLQTMVDGDGWRAGDSFSYSSCSKKLFDDFCEIAVKLGYPITTHARRVKNGVQYSVSIGAVQVNPTLNKIPDIIKYDGRIYCVQVPNSFIFVRRNGKCYWSGNSYKLQKYVEQIPSDEKPHIMLMGHFHNSFYMKYSDIHCIQIPALIDQTPYARSLGLNNEKGAWLIKMETDRSGNVITMEPELLDFSGQKKLIRKRN